MNKKNINNLGLQLYNNNKLIKNYSIDELLSYNHSGINSLVLKYYINENNIDKILFIINNNINLMKRDYLILILYYYKNNYNKSIYIFKTYILYNLENKDLDFILSNKLYKLLDCIDGFWLYTSQKTNLLNNYELLKLYYLDDSIINNILSIIELQIINSIGNKKSNILLDLNKFWELNYNNFNTIIDGGNIIHHINGQINISNINILIKNFDIKESLVIIHKKHNYNLSLNYLTPYNCYDDLFILWFFFKSKCKYNIITNDKFKDLINIINKIFNEIYSIKPSFIEYYISEKIINYNLQNKTIDNKKKYSNCIQKVDDNNYLIPTIDNNFVIVNILY